MILQYDDIILQVVARLRNVIPQTPKKVADISVMQNGQQDIDNFLTGGVEQSKIMVTYSGNTTEGGREVKDFVKTLDSNAQELAHTIEVHICAKKYMVETDSEGRPVTMLRLMYAVRAGLVGLKMFTRKEDGTLNFGDPMQAITEGMFLVETIIDRAIKGGIVAVCRFQVIEYIPQAEDVNPEQIWGTYQEITLQEYSQQDGTTPNPDGTGSPNDSVTVVKQT